MRGSNISVHFEKKVFLISYKNYIHISIKYHRIENVKSSSTRRFRFIDLFSFSRRKKERKSASWISVSPSRSINAWEGRNRSCFLATLAAKHRESFSEQRVTSNGATCKNVRIVNENSLEMQRFCLPPPPSPPPPPRRQLAASTNTRCGQMVMKERSRIPREVRAPLPFPPPFFSDWITGWSCPSRARAYPSRFPSPLSSLFLPPKEGRRRRPSRAGVLFFSIFLFLFLSSSWRTLRGEKKRRKGRCFPISLTLSNHFLPNSTTAVISVGNYPREETDLIEIKLERSCFSFPEKKKNRIRLTESSVSNFVIDRARDDWSKRERMERKAMS